MSDEQPIWERIAEHADSLPEEAIAGIPIDGAAQHDHYLYGSAKRHDLVNHPPHYTKGGIEVIEFIEAWQLDFHRGNVVKYVARAAHKGSELEDLRKAQWYLNRAIENQLAKDSP